MRTRSLLLPAAALLCAAASLIPLEDARAYTLIGHQLDLSQRDFRVWNNFTAPGANDNVTPDPSFPGYTGAVLAIWKGAVEWQSALHGDGNGDPHQPGGIGSGGANFDPTFQGENVEDGGYNGNTHSQISGCNGGVLAYTELPAGDGWRIRYYECWAWEDGPGTSIGGYDLQSVAAHEHGHAIGLGHSTSGQATMDPTYGQGNTHDRSIHADDQAGLQAIYGAASATKPRITGLAVAGNLVTITGTNLPLSGGQVWFTQAGAGGTGQPVKSTALTSDGTTLTASVPVGAGPGDVIVWRPGSSHEDLSNAWPADVALQCPPPLRYCVAAPNSVGAGAPIDHAGSTSVSAEDLAFTASGAPPGQFGVFFYGPDPAQVPFGEGFLCIAAGALGIYRLPPVVIDGTGSVQQPIDWDAPPAGSGPGALQPGSAWCFQFWYRDPLGGPAGFNLSDALEVSLCP
jgi:hypothetical protein